MKSTPCKCCRLARPPAEDRPAVCEACRWHRVACGRRAQRQSALARRLARDAARRHRALSVGGRRRYRERARAARAALQAQRREALGPAACFLCGGPYVRTRADQRYCCGSCQGRGRYYDRWLVFSRDRHRCGACGAGPLGGHLLVPTVLGSGPGYEAGRTLTLCRPCVRATHPDQVPDLLAEVRRRNARAGIPNELALLALRRGVVADTGGNSVDFVPEIDFKARNGRQ